MRLECVADLPSSCDGLFNKWDDRTIVVSEMKVHPFGDSGSDVAVGNGPLRIGVNRCSKNADTQSPTHTSVP